jgi:hypothetical protein
MPRIERRDNQAGIPSQKEAQWRAQMERIGIIGKYRQPTPQEIASMMAIPTGGPQTAEK